LNFRKLNYFEIFEDNLGFVKFPKTKWVRDVPIDAEGGGAWIFGNDFLSKIFSVGAEHANRL